MAKKLSNWVLLKLAERVFENVGTYDKYSIPEAIKKTLLNKRENVEYAKENPLEAAIWAKYLGTENLLPDGSKFEDLVTKSEYTPSISNSDNTLYYSFIDRIPEHYRYNALRRMLEESSNKTQIKADDPIFGEYKASLGLDDKGKYMSFYDIYDMSPSEWGTSSEDIGQKWWMPINTYPIEFYDRLYITPEFIQKANEYYKLTDLPFQIDNNYKNGGSMISSVNKWNGLSMKDRHKAIRAAVASGYTNLDDIRNDYNKLAEGGNLYDDDSLLSTIEKGVSKVGEKMVNVLPTWMIKAAERIAGVSNPNVSTEPLTDELMRDLFIANLWARENENGDYNFKNGKYYPFDSAEGGTPTIGPGLKTVKDGKESIYSPSVSLAKAGLTLELIDEYLNNLYLLLRDKVNEFINTGLTTNPADTVNLNIKLGLMDLRYQAGALGNWNKLRNAVLNGDIDNIREEAKAHWQDTSNVWHEDVRRNNIRNRENFRYLALGGPLFNPSSPLLDFQGNKKPLPEVRYKKGGRLKLI